VAFGLGPLEEAHVLHRFRAHGHRAVESKTRDRVSLLREWIGLPYVPRPVGSKRTSLDDSAIACRAERNLGVGGYDE